MQINKISIIGLGLIGGSIAKAIHEKTQINDVTAIIHNKNYLDDAIKNGVITRGFHELNEHVFDSDIVFLCTPVDISMDYLRVLLPKMKPGSIITDVGSTKGLITDKVKQLYTELFSLSGDLNCLEQKDITFPIFIGGHPMAGSEKSGYLATTPHLFENAFYVLTPVFEDQTTLDLLSTFVKDIGAIPVVIDSNLHDKLVSCISHVPHIIASGLVNLASSQDTHDEKLKLLAAGGFKDITRIASSDPALWEGIVRNNSEHVSDIIEKFITILTEFKDNLINNNSKEMLSFFENARKYRDSMPESKKSLIPTNDEITVDVKDKPGIIGEIATLLGNNNINIKNLQVVNSREYENGCLKIKLQDPDKLDFSCALLESVGFTTYKQ